MEYRMKLNQLINKVLILTVALTSLNLSATEPRGKEASDIYNNLQTIRPGWINKWGYGKKYNERLLSYLSSVDPDTFEKMSLEDTIEVITVLDHKGIAIALDTIVPKSVVSRYSIHHFKELMSAVDFWLFSSKEIKSVFNKISNDAYKRASQDELSLILSYLDNDDQTTALSRWTAAQKNLKVERPSIELAPGQQIKLNNPVMSGIPYLAITAQEGLVGEDSKLFAEKRAIDVCRAIIKNFEGLASNIDYEWVKIANDDTVGRTIVLVNNEPIMAEQKQVRRSEIVGHGLSFGTSVTSFRWAVFSSVTCTMK